MTNDDRDNQSPFHRGEQDVQARMGVRDIEGWARKVVRPFMLEEQRNFHTTLPYLVAAARDDKGRPWATLLTGAEGFITSPDPKSLAMAITPIAGDALEGAFSTSAHLGLLGIELDSRRRNRINGHATMDDAGVLIFSVDQAFGNCPQYIRERAWRRVEDSEPDAPIKGARLTSSQAAWIASADTFFIASGYQGFIASDNPGVNTSDNPGVITRNLQGAGESRTHGMDASHRGGEPGFVKVLNDAQIQFPDFAGNNHFNTIGNLVVDSRAGFLFVDFETGSLLQVTGRASIDWESDAVAVIPGARRLVTLNIDAIVELPRGVPLRWDASADSVRSLRLIEKTRESADITSFTFEARDGGPLPLYEAGQYLPIELDAPNTSNTLADNRGAVRRTYSLSGPPSADRYRISVKRDPLGVASRYLHDHVAVGAFVNAHAPAGDLILPRDECPVMLISAGVGITPMAAMLHTLIREGGNRPVWFIHGARNSAHHAFASEMRALAATRPGVNLKIAYSQPLAGDTLGVDFDHEGRIDGDLIRSLPEPPDTHYFLCGPTAFMADIQSALEAQDVLSERIHTEAF